MIETKKKRNIRKKQGMESPKVHRERECRGSAGRGTQKRALAKQNSMNKKIKKLTIVLG